MGDDKTRNMEHSGTCRNIPEHEKIKIIFTNKNRNNKIIDMKINNNVKLQKIKRERNKEKETRIISWHEKTIFCLK